MSNVWDLDSYVAPGAKRDPKKEGVSYMPTVIDAVAALSSDDRAPERLQIFRSRARWLFLIVTFFSVGAFVAGDGDLIGGCLAFGILGSIGWLWLIKIDDRHSPGGIEQRKNELIYALSIANMNSAERLRMAELDNEASAIELDKMRLSASHRQSSAIETQLIEDGLTHRVYQWLAALYDAGSLADDGRITCAVLWSARGGLSPSDRKQVRTILEDFMVQSGAWVVCERRNAWYLNVDRFPTKQAFEGCVGVCVGVHVSSNNQEEQYSVVG